MSIEESARFQGEAEAGWRRNLRVWDQYRSWNRADAVFLAAVVELVPNSITFQNRGTTEVLSVRDVVLKPVVWLKGDGPETELRIGPKELSSCGPHPFWPAMNGAPGDLHVVYVAGGAPSQETVLSVIPMEEVVEFETKSRLPAAQ